MPQIDAKYLIPFSEIEQSFNLHINQNLNYRILFSGRFGSGKTTFIKNYFANNQNFAPIYLTPVNYSISSNQDIFELIKYDILLEILNTYNPNLEKLDFSKLLTFQSLLIHSNDKLKDAIFDSGKEIAKKLIEAIPHIGKTATDIGSIAIDFFSKLENIASEHHKTITKEENKTVKDYIKSIKDTKGNTYEKDGITNIIIKLISEIKKSSEKEVILIIDDLDRLDPGHIFRILNIFSAHIDIKHHEEEQFDNKFGFDKIMLACDVKNIRHIFAANYGQNTHFSGYIDKFYSINIFYFSITKKAYEVTKLILKNVLCNNIPLKDGTVDNKLEYLFTTIDHTYTHAIGILFSHLVRYDLINIRSLNKLRSIIYNFQSKESDDHLTDIDQGATLFINLLDKLYSSDDEIYWILEQGAKKWPQNLYNDDVVSKVNKVLLGSYGYLKRIDFEESVTENIEILKHSTISLDYENNKYSITIKILPAKTDTSINHRVINGELNNIFIKNQNVSGNRLTEPIYLSKINPFWILIECYKLYRFF